MFSSLFLAGQVPTASVYLLCLCLIVSSIGFKRPVWFISIGYGYSIAAMAIGSLAFGGMYADWITWSQAILLAIYGLRLGSYLILREGNSGYRATLAADGDREEDVGLATSFGIWICVSLLYVSMFMPVIERLSAAASGRADSFPALSTTGAFIILAGILIESIADFQKSAAKKIFARRFCDKGLFRFVRCPNYFGEILVWTGNLIAGATLIHGWLAWLISAAGYCCIILIMIGSTRRLEIKQDERYGEDPEYLAYAKKVPVLIPFLPLYSVKNARIYLG